MLSEWRDYQNSLAGQHVTWKNGLKIVGSNRNLHFYGRPQKAGAELYSTHLFYSKSANFLFNSDIIIGNIASFFQFRPSYPWHSIKASQMVQLKHEASDLKTSYESFWYIFLFNWKKKCFYNFILKILLVGFIVILINVKITYMMLWTVPADKKKFVLLIRQN